ncbi:Ribosome-recycling factor [Lachnellula suecica]|uniref:Ribosome-recycling factor n=1 Tax=Lachnellula suecica TaxID=602035 RepID=A0A8T9C0E8_9HELO|nr:Ribosome-recycling factor [Lachnellula suecica]
MPPRIPIRANALKQLFSRASASSEASIALRATAFTLPQSTSRTLSHSPPLLKKKSKVDREREETARTDISTDNPFDFGDLEKGIEKAIEKLKNDLSKLRTGGRFNPEVLENLRVGIKGEGKKMERLGDLAQVLPKGRVVMVLVGEKDHLHPVMSAIQGAKDINLQPQPDAQNPNQLNVPIPPPTKESRDLALAAASKTGETAKAAVQSARSVNQKRLRGMEVKKLHRPDDIKKAQKQMETIVEKGTAEVKKVVDEARKNMEQA